MEIRFICVGKTGKSFLEEGEKEYAKRLKHYVKFSSVVIPDVKQAKSLSEDQVKQKEADAILAKIKPGERIFLLDEKGKEFTSSKFSGFIQKQFNQGGQSIVFIVGGPYGFAPIMYEKAVSKISLSQMTFSHQMIRVFFIEQLYRVMTILKGEPYHHE